MDHPYYIVCPPWSRTSAGVKVLYSLCNLINKSGFSSYIYLKPYSNNDLASSPVDIAPFLNSRVINYHFINKITPIVIYPETISLDNLSPPVSVRYVLNYENYLSSNNKNLDVLPDDYLIAYSKIIARKTNRSINFNRIFLLVSDANFFVSTGFVNRSGGVFYAGKFKYHFGGKTYSITDGCVEITRDRSDSQSPEEIRALFQKAEFFYCYEDSALAIEAMLCGCPVILLPNEHFSESLAAEEMGNVGLSWGTDPESISHAKATVHLFRDRYLKLQEEAVLAVREMIEATQKIAANKPYTKRFAEGYLKPPGLIVQAVDICRFLSDVLQDKGFIGTAKIIFKRIRAGRFKIYS